MSDSARPRSGAHRPRRSPAAVLVPVGLALAAVLALLVAVSGLGGGPDDQDAASSTGSTGSSSSSTSATSKTSSTSKPPKTPADTPSTTKTSSSSSSSSSSTSGVDRSASLSVLNATRTPGLASKASRRLKAAGWSVRATGNYRQQRPPTTVYYADPDLKATAQAVADDLGGSPEVSENGTFGAGRVTVVLGDDYSG